MSCHRKLRRWLAAPTAKIGAVLLALSIVLPAHIASAAPSLAWGANLQTADVVPADLDGVTGIHVGTVRQGLRWAMIEPKRPAGGVHTYNWTKTDARVAAAAKAGLQTLGVCGNPPQWAMAGSTYGVLPGPDYFQDYADYFLAVIQRYGAPPYNVRYFEITNEPDIGVNEDNVVARAEAYVEILKRVWRTTAVFRETPVGREVKFVGMVLTHTPVSLAHGAVQSNKFFERIWDDPALYDGTRLRDKFHILSFHTYTGFFGPETGNPAGIGAYWEDALQPTLAKVAGAKPMWITEAGYSTATDGKGLLSHANETGTRADAFGWQARYLVRMAVVARGAGFERFFQFNVYSGGTAGDSAWGLFNPDHTKKPSFAAYRNLTAILDDGVTALERVAYSRSGETPCIYRYTKRDGCYGWIAWHAPVGQTLAADLGDGAIASSSRIRSRQMLDDTWTDVPNPGTGTLRIVATNSPQYIEVTPVIASTRAVPAR